MSEKEFKDRQTFFGKNLCLVNFPLLSPQLSFFFRMNRHGPAGKLKFESPFQEGYSAYKANGNWLIERATDRFFSD